jgi:hypothetical protein
VYLADGRVFVEDENGDIREADPLDSIDAAWWLFVQTIGFDPIPVPAES